MQRLIWKGSVTLGKSLIHLSFESFEYTNVRSTVLEVKLSTPKKFS